MVSRPVHVHLLYTGLNYRVVSEILESSSYLTALLADTNIQIQYLI
jgi:hypothetical protein